MSSLSEISIKKPVFAWMLMAALIVFGTISFRRMGVSQLPDVDFPVVNVSVGLEGAAPEVMEMNVVDPIEDVVMTIQGVKSVSSSARNSQANITVEFDLSKNIDVAVQEIQNALSQVARRLPKDIDPPTVNKINPEDQPILWMAATSDKLTQKELMTFVRERLKDQFTTVSGVGEVFLGGYIDPSLRVWVSSEKLNRYALTVTDVMNAIQLEHAEVPAGRIETEITEKNVRILGEAPSPEEFAKLAINRRGGAPNFTPISLGQVADIEDGLSDVRRISRSNFKPAVGMGVRKQRGSNAVEVAKGVKAKLKELQKQLPDGVNIFVRFDATTFIEESVAELNFTLILSALLTALVCWLFLGSLSATMNVILAIPTSVIGSFIVLYALGFTLNTFTLLGLSLAIGIVVDDAIIVLENIVRHYESGKSRVESALVGTREIAFAAMAATAAVIAIFLPVAFMSGIIGKFFFQFGVTLSVAVALSLLEALTLTPMRCSQYLNLSERRSKLGRAVEGFFNGAATWYHKWLIWSLDRRGKVVLGGLIFFIASAFLVKFIKKEFVPAQDQGRLMIRVQTPVGSSLEFTDNRFKEIEKYIMSRPEAESYFGAIGGFGGGEVNTGMLFATFKPYGERPKDPEKGKRLTQTEIADALRKGTKQFKDMKIFIQDMSLAVFSGKRGGFPIEFTIRGGEWDKLVELSQKFSEEMKQSGQMTDIDTDYQAGMTEIQIVPDRDRARARGVSVRDIGDTINALVGGSIAGKFSKHGHRYDVRVRLVYKDRTKAEDLRRLMVRNNRGELIPLSDVVQISEKKTAQAVFRQDRERAISLFANVAKTGSQSAAIETIQALEKKLLPPGYRVVIGGSSQTFKESFEGLIFALILGLVVSYMVLASQFNSFVHPITVLVALPFSLSGAFITLLLGRQSLNIFSMIGLLLLMGIVKKNSILLVDFTNQLREKGLGIREALTEACPLRLRPILMTSIATIVGAIPPALALGPGAETRIPMALSVIGGVTVSTVLTLFVVPCVYTYLSKEKKTLATKETE